jgi:hypothetical protein
VLPVVLKPQPDERLSSWLGRLAWFYGMPIDAFLECCGLPRCDVNDLEWRLGGGEGALLVSRTRMAIEELRAMTFEEVAPHARLMVALGSRYVCPLCPGGIQRKTTALPWSFWCPEHGVRLAARGGRELEGLSETQLMMLDLNALAGAMRLANWSRGKDEGLPSVPQLLDFLTTRHRRSSPPSLAEQPRLSLQARRANHGFLTCPIARQALLVVVPEYDRVAPVLAKPVRSGLFSLTQGSLLQNYALAVGVGRLSADTVGYSAAVLMASDEEGEERLRETLRAWPLTLRRRVYARCRRLHVAHSGASSSAEGVQSGQRRGQSHKFRFSQSHNYARGIS